MAEYVRLRDRTEEKLAPRVAAVADLKQALADYAREHGGQFVLFGSAARREMRDDSDVDILVDFPATTQSAAISFAERTCEQLGLKPDILAFGRPAGRFRDRVDKEGLVLPGDEDSWSDPMSEQERWNDILDAARSAASHFRAAVQLFERGGFDEGGLEGYGRGAAVLYAMLRGHTALEDSLVRIMKALGEPPSSGSDWHQQVIERAATAHGRRPAILSPLLLEATNKTRGLRHFAARAYTAAFDPNKARPAIEAAQILADGFEEAIASFVKTMHPD